jgi:hypothetical protein
VTFQSLRAGLCILAVLLGGCAVHVPAPYPTIPPARQKVDGWRRDGDVQPYDKYVDYDGRRAIELVVERNEYPDMNVMLWKKARLRGLHFSVLIYPTADCDASADPAAVLGLQIVDAMWDRVTFCISSRHRFMRVAGTKSGDTLIVLPGRLDAWNRIDSSVGGILALIPLTPDANGMIRVGPVATLHRPDGPDTRPPVLRGAFADFRLLHG